MAGAIGVSPLLRPARTLVPSLKIYVYEPLTTERRGFVGLVNPKP